MSGGHTRRTGAIGCVLLGALAGCDLDASYRKYCGAHPGECTGFDAGTDDAGTDGGGSGGGATQLRLRVPTTSGGYEPRRCITGFLAVSTDEAGREMAFSASGRVVVAISPDSGVDLYEESSCDGGAWVGGRKAIDVAANGGGLGQRFSAQASLAGRYSLELTTQLVGVSNAPVEQLDFPARLAFVGAPASVTLGACVGPVRVMLLDEAGGTIGTNSPMTVALAPVGGVEVRADGACATTGGPVNIDAGSALSTGFWLRGTASSGPASLNASAPIHRNGTATVGLLPMSTGEPACVADGAPCLPGESLSCCDAGTCVTGALGYGLCQ